MERHSSLQSGQVVMILARRMNSLPELLENNRLRVYDFEPSKPSFLGCLSELQTLKHLGIYELGIEQFSSLGELMISDQAC